MAGAQSEVPFDEGEIVEQCTTTGFEYVGELPFENINGYTLRTPFYKRFRRALGIEGANSPDNDCYINRDEGIFVISFSDVPMSESEYNASHFDHIGPLRFESGKSNRLRATFTKEFRTAIGLSGDSDPDNDCYINRDDGLFVIRFSDTPHTGQQSSNRSNGQGDEP